MSRFFVDSSMVKEKNILITNPDDIKHMTKVLRLLPGDIIDVSDSVAWEYKAEIVTIDKDLVEVKILDIQKFAREPMLEVNLYQGIPKQGKMETIIQKTVELGIHSITPVFTDRTVVTDKGNFSKKIERWQKVSDEAVKQCKRGIIPKINKEMNFKEMINDIVNNEIIVFPYENEENTTIKGCLQNLKIKPKSVGVIIGPEGGFSDKEAAMLKENGALCVTLGKTILRTETAGMAALAMIMYELEL